jgi:hypothetical protein
MLVRRSISIFWLGCIQDIWKFWPLCRPVNHYLENCHRCGSLAISNRKCGQAFCILQITTPSDFYIQDYRKQCQLSLPSVLDHFLRLAMCVDINLIWFTFAGSISQAITLTLVLQALRSLYICDNTSATILSSITTLRKLCSHPQLIRNNSVNETNLEPASDYSHSAAASRNSDIDQLFQER